MGRHELEIDQGQKADRIVSPDRRDDPGDLWVSDRSVEVVDARMGMLGEEVRIGKGVRPSTTETPKACSSCCLPAS
jgi:hypothetical protein